MNSMVFKSSFKNVLASLELGSMDPAQLQNLMEDPGAEKSAPDERLKAYRRFDYAILEEIGRGRAGVVYRARHLSTDIELALKSLHELSPEHFYHLKREFHALCEIQHPNLVHIYELVAHAGNYFFTMELIEGPHLLPWVRNTAPAGSFTPDIGAKTWRGIAQLADALATIHEAGRIHRDVKPNNVRLSDNGRVVLLDFDLIAFTRTDSQHTRDIAGTLQYMAPEAIWTSRSGTPADIYSLGVVAYECLTGQQPFPGRDPVQLDRLKRAGLPPLPELVPSWFAELVKEMTDPEADARPNAREVHDRIAEHAPVRISNSPSLPPMVGRKQAMNALKHLLREHDETGPTVVRISGPSGIGKTHFVRTFFDEALSNPQHCMLEGRCLPIATVPLQGIDGIADALSQELNRLEEDELAACISEKSAELLQLFPILARVDALIQAASSQTIAVDLRERRRHGFSAFHSLLRALSKLRKVVVWVDDIQWSDHDSLSFWTEAIEKSIPIFFIATAREINSYQPLDASKASRLKDIELGPLTSPEIKELLKKMPGADRSEEKIAFITKESQGNPFLIQQLAEHEHASEQLTDSVIDLSLAEVLKERLENTTPSARKLLEFSCIATKPLTLDTLAKAADVSAPAKAAGDLLRLGRLIERARLSPKMKLLPYHDRIRQAIIVGLPEVELRARHFALAKTLSADENADAVATFWHWHHSKNTQMAHKYAIKAGDRLMQAMAFDQAVDIYTLALESERHLGDNWEIHEKLGAAYEASGKGRLAGESYEKAASLCDRLSSTSPRSRELTRRSAEAFLRSGFVDQGTKKLDELLPIPSRALPRSVASLIGFSAKQKLLSVFERLLRKTPNTTNEEILEQLDTLWSVTVGMVWADNATSAYYQALHARLALTSDNELHRARAIATENCYLAAVGPRFLRYIARAHEKQCLKITEELQNPNLSALVYSTIAATGCTAGNWSKTIELCERVIDLCENQCTGAGWELSNAYIFGAWSLGMQGKLNAIESLRSKMLEHARVHDDRLAATYVRVGLPSLTYLAHDLPHVAKEMSEEALEEWPSTIGFSPLDFHASLGSIQTCLYQGDALNARQIFEKMAHGMRGSLLLYNQIARGWYHYLDGCTSLAMCQRTTNHKEHSKHLNDANRAGKRLKRESANWCRAKGHAVLASVIWKRGNHKKAMKALEETEMLFEQADMSLHRAASAYHLARFNGSTRPTFNQQVVNPKAMAQCLLPFAFGEP